MNTTGQNMPTAGMAVDFRQWTFATSWADVEPLLRNPPEFVNYTVGKKLGDLERNPVVTVQFFYLDLADRQPPQQAKDVVIEGIEGTNFLRVRVMRLPDPSEQALACIQAAHDNSEPIQVILRQAEPLGYFHFHVAGDPQRVLGSLCQQIRQPEALLEFMDGKLQEAQQCNGCRLDRLRIQDEHGNALDSFHLCVDHPGVRNPGNDPRPSAALSLNASPRDTPAGTAPPSIRPGAPLRQFNYGWDASTAEPGGCHSAQGTYTLDSDGNVVLSLDTVNCEKYTAISMDHPDSGTPAAAASATKASRNPILPSHNVG